MLIEELRHLRLEQLAFPSLYLKRQVVVDLYLPNGISGSTDLLLINDGQDLGQMSFQKMLDGLFNAKCIRPLLCVGIHAALDRKNEYGTAGVPDYAGRGSKAGAYQRFVIEELVPYIKQFAAILEFRQMAFAGFSLGGLSALDIVWHHPHLFSKAGVFSGSLWWRSKDLGEGYSDDTDRIMHQLIRKGGFAPHLKFYFTTGSLDETADRNHNGIIDSIDDTLDLIEELKEKGYKHETDMVYINYEDGKHDVATWCRAMPGFLNWLSK